MPVFQLHGGRELWLASGSPRRKEVLAQLGLAARIIVPINAEPEQLPSEQPDQYALRAARAKSTWAQKQLDAKGAVIIAADTVVYAKGQILGKPDTPAKAMTMLEMLNASWHSVFTAVAIVAAEQPPILFCEKTDVHFADWPKTVLRAYLQTGDSLDKAGAYGIQSEGAFLSDNLRGAWSNVVGLPVARLLKSLLELGVIVPHTAIAP